MLYIASALTPTPITHTVKVEGFTSSDTTSLVVAKPDRIEVWDVTSSGLQFRSDLKVWGTIAGLATVSMPDARPHVLVLVGPPNAVIFLATFENGSLEFTANETLRPPSLLLRRQEFFTGVVTEGSTVLVSLWSGLLACLEMELEKSKDMKRRASTAGGVERRRVIFKQGSTFNINIREHNLLDMTFLPGNPSVLTFLWMSEYNKIQVQPRLLSAVTRSFTELAPPTDVVNPLEFPVTKMEDLDFEAVPFSCPAGRNVLAVGNGPTGTRLFLVIGDEHAVLYSVTAVEATNPTSPRASAVRRSPQNDMGGVGKKRKSSASGRSVNTDMENTWSVKPVWRVRQGWGTVLAATVLDNHGSGGSVVIGDECGRLTTIGWEFDGSDTVHVGLVDLGALAPPTALTYLDNGFLFVSSACSDSLLVSLESDNAFGSPSASASCPRTIKGKGRAQESADAGAWSIVQEPDSQRAAVVRERWMNIAPVKDFAVVEEDDGRVSHLVVASGAGNTNSLRIVRSGAGLDDTLTVEGIPGIERMWTLAPGDRHPHRADHMDDCQFPTILVSFWASSAILSLEPQITPVAAADAITSVATIAAGLANGGKVLAQVSARGIHLWADIAAGASVGSFNTESSNEIVAAAVRQGHVVAAFQDGTIIVWKAGASLEQIHSIRLSREASAIDINVSGDILVAVSDWNGGIQVFNSEGLSSGKSLLSTEEASYATSLLFSVNQRQLLAGLSDGTLVNYDISASISSGLDKARTRSSLGSRPLQLVPVDMITGNEEVFAAGISERLTLVFDTAGHTEVSASGKKGVVAAASVTVPSLGSCIVLATADGLCFSRLTSLKKLQVQTLDLDNKSVTRLNAIPDQKLLAAGTVTQTLDSDTGDILQASGVEIRDPMTLELLANFQLPEREAVTSVSSALLGGKRYVIVGTAVFPSDESAEEARLDELSSFIGTDKGRVIILEATQRDERWALSTVTSFETSAAVLDCVVIHDFIAIATPAKVSILRLDDTGLTETSKCTFAFEAHFLAVSKDAEGTDLLAIGDAMRSILLIDVNPETGVTDWSQRDMSSHGVRALAGLHDGGPSVIISDEHSGLLTFRLKDDIEPAASFGLHEDVARIRPGSLSSSTAPDVLRPDVLFATANGRLGVIGELGSSATRTLDDLQRNMNKFGMNPGPWSMPWKTYRRGGSLTVPKETAGFIDGDYLTHFSSLTTEDVDRALHGSSAHENVYKITDKGRAVATASDVERLLEIVQGMY